MPRLSITLTDDQNERIEELVENGEYSSKNAVVQEWLTRAERVNQLESEVERLRQEKRLILEQREEHGELVEYAQTNRQLERERLEASLLTRGKWWLFGKSESD